MELFDKEKYSEAQEQFASVISSNKNDKSEVVVNASYYHALCGLNLFNNDAEALLIEFTLNNPESPKTKLAYFHLGNYYFRKKKYKNVLIWLAKIDAYDLSIEEAAEYYFKKGYSYFVLNDFEKASSSFYEIKDSDNAYSSASKYYYAHIAYLQKKYEPALQTFLQLKEDDKFAGIVPYYITQIYYLQENYDAVISYAPALIDSAIPNRVAEISRLLGDAYFRTKQYNKSIPYLLKYNNEKPVESSRADFYELGFAYFKSDSCEGAIDWFKKSIADKDSITQVAHYHLAECYLKLGEKKFAQNSFREAAFISFDPQIEEDALFSFAKIAYELSYHPFNDAIKAFEKFINTYPNSSKLNDAYTFLLTVYFTTKNYEAALTSLENINKLDYPLQEAYQKVAYYRGIDLFNSLNYTDAIIHFDKSDKYPISSTIKLENNFWKAEAFFRLNNFEQAINQYKKFIYQPNSISTSNYNEAHYNLGYAYFKLKEYKNAEVWFRKYVQNDPSDQNSIIKNDALNRIGDCFFISKEYKSAIEFYDKAAMIGVYQQEYSLYQSAIANGVIGNYNDKTSLLNTLISQKKPSYLLDDAIYELASTQQEQGSLDKALANYNLLLSNHKNSPYVSRALTKKGLILYNQNDDSEALITFKKVITDYPSTKDADEALSTIKKIYIENGDLTSYEQYLASIGNVNEAQMIMDKDYYEVAENNYMNGNCNQATNDFKKYLEKYPTGTYKINAHFYKATCEIKAGFINEALIDLNEVIKAPKNNFTENAIVNAGKINKTLGNINEALENYSQLEYLADVPENVFMAQVEQMRLNFELNNIDNTIKYCQLIINKAIKNELLHSEAHLIYAKASLQKDNYNLAFKEFSTVASANNKFGVEAKYNLANIHFLRAEYKSCESEVFSLVKLFPSYDYWIGKALILLSDNYFANNDVFQAKITLKNIKENSKHLELVAIANEKLSLIENQEQEKEDVKEKEVELKLYDNIKLDDLFFEEEKVD